MAPPLGGVTLMSASASSILFLAMTVALGAQDAPATFKSNSNLVIINVTVRDTRGRDIDAACGQLALAAVGR